MPRQARLDYPGLMHHVMVRGLNRQVIFKDKDDYAEFLARVAAALTRSSVEILAWALMPNHLHFLLRSGAYGMAPFLRRLLTGYALTFNRRHRRVGYVYQGRYKSLICDEEEYLLTLVRYIHLNPVSGGLVPSLQALRGYPFTGHSTLMGMSKHPWQSIDDVLGRFGVQAGHARQHYERYLQEGLPEVRRQPTDILGAGLVEQLRQNALRHRRDEDRAFQDPRILGESDFVSRVWQETEERERLQRQLKHGKKELRSIAKHIASAYAIPERSLFERGRQPVVSQAKAAFIFAGVDYLGQTVQAMARLTRMSAPAASKAKHRGAEAKEKINFSKLLS